MEAARTLQLRGLRQLHLRRGSAGVAAAYGGRLERLTALKDRFDPTNFLRMNANIPPSNGGTP
ncbi:MAG: BBE domain-containing protein [Actinobacteria bacterium]|nr:BBE domain-containing protein [Actinomycetota bacterium]